MAEQMRHEYIEGKRLESLYDFGFNAPITLKQDAAATENYPAGLVLGLETASGKYVPYDNAGSGGAEVAVAILYNEIDLDEIKAGDKVASAWKVGVFRKTDLTGLDAAAETDLAKSIYFE